MIPAAVFCLPMVFFASINSPERMVLAVAHTFAVFWAYMCISPKTRKRASRWVLPYFAGLFCAVLAFWNLDLILRWDTMFQRWLALIMPQTLVAFTTKFMYPTGYMLGAWVLGFALALHFVLRREKKRNNDAVPPAASAG